MNRAFRIILYSACVILALFALGFILQVPWVISLWPLPYSDTTNLLFIASIFLAASASMLWCLMKEEYGALSGVALDYVVILAPLAIYAFQLNSERPTSSMTSFMVACALTALGGLGLFLWSIRLPIEKSPPMPWLVRVSFVIFVIALLFAGWQLVNRTPGILPWQTTPATVVMYGWMFLGAAAYFIYGLARPGWRNAGGQLAGFLAYDLVLIVPFALMLPGAAPARRINLLIYIAVVTYSGLLAIYYLFINRTTKIFPLRARL
jgi:hypothetical protein